MPEKQAGTESSFEDQIQGLEKALESSFTPKPDENLARNLEMLHYLTGLDRFSLEAFFSHNSGDENTSVIISFDDADYARVQLKLQSLIAANEIVAKEQEIDVTKFIKPESL